MVKFMFSPLIGPTFDLTFMETYIANLAGALIAMTLFYFAAEYFLKRNHNNKIKKYKIALASGKALKKQKIFTKRNKTIVRLKNKIGIIPFSFWAPLLLSIPIGSIITAKFFGKRKWTYPLMVIGATLNNSIIVSLVYFLKYEASVIL